ncbi:helix-turn-helix domain-containing protein [Thiobacillus sp.]|jgi:hypothetical protein|uniref:helix-turn-helix domain-containing protein n=1 Tax=Thiobacillus sp. TaxID=924 RepID=UPI0034465597
MTSHTDKQQSKSPLIDRDRAAEYIGVRPQTLACWASTRRYALPFVRIGRRAMYRQSDLDAFIERNVIGGEVQQ